MLICKKLCLTFFIILFFVNKNVYGEAIEVTLIAVGDIMMDSEIGDIIKAKGKNYPLKEVYSILKKGDITFGNLESILGTKKSQPIYKDLKPYNFIVPLDYSQILKDQGFTVINLANNHAMDYGPEPIKETREILLNKGMKSLGAGKDLKESRMPALVDIKGIKFAFLGYSKTYPSSGYAEKDKAGVTPIDLNYIKEDIKNIRDKADFVIVSIHWGTEYKFMPADQQKEIAHKTIDYGADMILGHHPHVLQGIEIYKNKFIIYSLGNFLFDQENYWKDKSIILSCKFTKDKLRKVDIIPLDRFEKYLPRKAEGKEKKNILKKIKEISILLNSSLESFKAFGLD